MEQDEEKETLSYYEVERAEEFKIIFSLSEKDFFFTEMVEMAKTQISDLEKMIRTQEKYIDTNKETIKKVDKRIKEAKEFKDELKRYEQTARLNIEYFEKAVEHLKDCIYKFT